MTRKELEALWAGRYVENVPDEMMALLREVEKLNPLNTVLEIGVRTCGTFRLWERLVPAGRGLVIGVDIVSVEDLLKSSGASTRTPELIYDRNPGPRADPVGATFWNTPPSAFVYEEDCTIDCLDPKTSDRELYFVTADSASLSAHNHVAAILGNRQVDFVFHDGWHFGEGPSKDFDNLVLPFLRPGGLLAIADVGNQGDWRANGGTLALCKRLSSGQKLPQIEPEMCKTGMRNRAGIALWWKP